MSASCGARSPAAARTDSRSTTPTPGVRGRRRTWRPRRSSSCRRKPRPKEGESRAASPSHSWRPGPETGSSGLPGKGSGCGLVVLSERNSDSAALLESSLHVPLLSPSFIPPAAGNPTRRLGALPDPKRLRHVGRARGRKGGSGARRRRSPRDPIGGRAALWGGSRSAVPPAAVRWSARGPGAHPRGQERLRASHMGPTVHTHGPYPFRSPWTELRDLPSGGHRRSLSSLDRSRLKKVLWALAGRVTVAPFVGG